MKVEDLSMVVDLLELVTMGSVLMEIDMVDWSAAMQHWQMQPLLQQPVSLAM